MVMTSGEWRPSIRYAHPHTPLVVSAVSAEGTEKHGTLLTAPAVLLAASRLICHLHQNTIRIILIA